MKAARVLAAAGMLAGCAASNAQRGTYDRNIITAEQVTAANAQTAFELVQRLRPSWLTARGGARSLNLPTNVLVFSDGMRLGGVDALRQIPGESVESVRYMDASEASNQLPGVGSGEHVAGAIIVTRRGSARTSR